MIKGRHYLGLGMAVVLGWAIAACSDSIPSTTAEEKPVVEGKYYLNLTFRMADATGSRAAVPDYPSTPGAASESQINTLHVFFVDADRQCTVVPLNVNMSGDDESAIRIPLEEPLSEDITLYLGANLNENQVEAFMGGNNAYKLKYDVADYVNDLSPYSIGYEGDESSETGIAMFCTEEAKPEPMKGKYNVYTVSFSLKRLVAKVLLTCEASESGGAYVQLKQDKDPNFQGWIRPENVWYLVNARNRLTYIMQKLIADATDTDANVEDANMFLTEYVEEAFNTGDAAESQYLKMVSENFSYYPRDEFRGKPHFRRTLLYEKGRIADNSANPYTEGVYCPENTFSFTKLTSDEEQQLTDFKFAWGMITHVAIMAKFIPRFIYVEYGLFDYIRNNNSLYFDDLKEEIEDLRPSEASNPSDEDVFLIDCETEEIAKALLTASLMFKGMLSPASENKFPEETFFFHTESDSNTADGSDTKDGSVGAYYTYGAACIKYDSFDSNDPKNLGNYVPHLSGWGYYYTYIDNRSEAKKTADNPFTFYKHGQVERNRYYILNIRSFSSPGTSIQGAEYIEVNTVTKDWIPGGEGNITLE